MSNSKLLWLPKPPATVSYAVAVFSIAAVVAIAQWIEFVFQSAPQVSLLLCAVMFSAWLGGVGPGVLAIALSALAFDYYFLPPVDSLVVDANQLPRLLVFLLSAVLVGSLSALQRSTAESLRHARDDLRGTVQALQQTNQALQAENVERKRAEQQLTQAAQLLEQRVAERTRELSTLLETSNTIASTLELQPLLRVVLSQLQVVMPYTGATILSLEDDDLVGVGHSGPLSAAEVTQIRLPAAQSVGYQAVRDGGPVIVDDLLSDSPQAQAFRESLQAKSFAVWKYARSLLVVPLIVRERLIGILWIDSNRPNAYSVHDAQLALVFANQSAAAIENARLYDQARDLATIEERQRLARELHDAVTQTLFSASLIAEALPDAWRRSPEMGQRGVEELRLLTRGALAEMRTLLLELRPTALAEKPFGELLRALCVSVTSRTRVPIALTLTGDALLAPALQIALYRITQEVLNNIAKHAAASQVTISGCYDAEQVQMQISDDGRGFDPDARAPSSLGLDIMRERATSIGATLHVDSQPGAGTTVRIDWQATPMTRAQGG